MHKHSINQKKIAGTVTICALVFLFLYLSGSSSIAEPFTFIFKAPESSNPVNIRIDSLFELNKGSAAKIDGHICIDPKTRKIISGKIIIPSAAIIMSNRIKTAMLHSKDWLNKIDHPYIVFEFNSVEKIIESGKSVYSIIIKGDLTIKETTKKAFLPVKIICKGGFDHINAKHSELPELAFISSFSINRTDFKIKADIPNYIINKTIYLDINLCGFKLKK